MFAHRFLQIGLGYFLSQKHCDCKATSPGCCENGWRITLAGSRFNKPAETRYAPVEGEALAIAWSLEQTKFFTQGCDNLVILTDHQPLIKVFGDATLDEVSNRRLFNLKEKTFPWKFTVEHRPGKENSFADATSRHPATTTDDDDIIASITMSEILAGIAMEEEDDDLDEAVTCVAGLSQHENIRAITWEIVREETRKDHEMITLISLINSSFPEEKEDMPHGLSQYWTM